MIPLIGCGYCEHGSRSSPQNSPERASGFVYIDRGVGQGDTGAREPGRACRDDPNYYPDAAFNIDYRADESLFQQLGCVIFLFPPRIPGRFLPTVF